MLNVAYGQQEKMTHRGCETGVDRNQERIDAGAEATSLCCDIIHKVAQEHFKVKGVADFKRDLLGGEGFENENQHLDMPKGRLAAAEGYREFENALRGTPWTQEVEHTLCLRTKAHWRSSKVFQENLYKLLAREGGFDVQVFLNAYKHELPAEEQLLKVLQSKRAEDVFAGYAPDLSEDLSDCEDKGIGWQEVKDYGPRVRFSIKAHGLLRGKWKLPRDWFCPKIDFSDARELGELEDIDKRDKLCKSTPSVDELFDNELAMNLSHIRHLFAQAYCPEICGDLNTEISLISRKRGL